MLRLFSKFKWYDWLFVLLLVGISFGQAYFDVYLPGQTRILFNRMLSGYAESYLWQAGGSVFLYAGGSFAANLVGTVIAGYLAAAVGQSIRRDLFSKVQSFGFEEMNRFSTASLITRSTNDVTQVQNVMAMMLRVAISAPITAIWAIVRINDGSRELTNLTAVTMSVVMVMMTLLAIFILPKFRLIQILTDKLNGVTRQNLTGLRVVKAYNADRYEQEKFHKVNHQLNRTNVYANSIMVMLMPLLILSMNGIHLAIFWLGAHLINAGSIDFPGLMEFNGLIMQVLMAFLMAAMMLVMVPRAQVSAGRILQVLRTRARITDPENPAALIDANRGEVEFDNVSFRYPGAEGNVLEGVSFKVARGQTAAFIGSTGSGKSTLINLVPRFYDVTEGCVKVAGRDVRELCRKDLRAVIGYVPQKGVLFKGTVESNINFGQAQHSDVAGAARVAMADEFVQSLDKGFQAPVSQGGKNFSGGQKQRMSIARAIAVQPEIFIFDDSFSALDYKTDKEVRKRLRQHTQGATCLIVAQRIGTIMDADMIVVLDQGKVVGTGTHQQLLQSCAAYQEIALSQLSEEELTR